MNNVDVVTFTIIFDQVQSLIWFKIFVKQKKSFVCIEDIKFAIISKFSGDPIKSFIQVFIVLPNEPIYLMITYD